MQLITRLLICLSITFTLVLSQTKEDLSRPYEFGFTVDQQQHRHEKKDERGIIQGEFGFITADGIYHVTVYATDENGNFKILSMRNLRVSAPLDGSPLPKGAKIETFPGQSNAAIAPQSQNLAPSIPPPQTNNYPGPATPSSIVFHPTIGPGCGGCKVIAKRPPNKPFTFQDAFQNNRGPNSVSGPNPGDGFPPNSNAPQGQVITQNGPQVTTQNGPGILAPNVGIADRFSPNSNGLQGNTPNFGPNANIPGVNNPSSSSFGQNNPVGPNQGPNGAITNNFGPDGTSLDAPGPGGNKKPSFSVLPPSANTVGGPNPGINDPLPPSLPPISVDEGVIHVQGDHPMDIPIKDKFPGMQNGLPPQVSEKDITGLLYKFRYTVGFHGHYEKGLKNGAKVGGYFVNGRDGVSRIVTYIADENGYRPKFKFVRLGLDSDETPKEGSEKSFGLKSFEFVWYPIE